VIDIDDPAAPGERLGETDYEAFLAGAIPSTPGPLPDDEWEAIALNYTSGTTGNPKGVVYHHRGAYLNAVGNTLEWDGCRCTRSTSGPCRCSTATAGASPGPSPRAGTNVCLRKVDRAKAIYDAIADHGVTISAARRSCSA
jgi:fatty-acyl-CoA synthase